MSLAFLMYFLLLHRGLKCPVTLSFMLILTLATLTDLDSYLCIMQRDSVLTDMVSIFNWPCRLSRSLNTSHFRIPSMDMKVTCNTFWKGLKIYCNCISMISTIYLQLLCTASRHRPSFNHLIFHHPKMKAHLPQEVAETCMLFHWKVSFHSPFIMFSFSVLLLGAKWAIRMNL